jgi:hypothetical protein
MMAPVGAGEEARDLINRRRTTILSLIRDSVI